MKSLQTILEGLSAQVIGRNDVPIQDIVFDSRKVKKGSLFVALRGTHADGHRFIPQAVEAGAVAILAEEKQVIENATLVLVPDTLKALNTVAVRFWDDPSRKLLVVGITGTNGKTTVSFLVE